MAPTPEEQRRERLEARRDRSHRLARWCIAGGGLAVLALTLLFGGLVAKVVAAVVVLAMLQGLWRGGAELVGIVSGLVLAVPIAVPVGRAMEGVTAALAGTSGLTNRLISIGIVAALVTLIGGLAGRFAAKRVRRAWPGYKRWDPYLGAVLGAAEGCLLALVLMWAPLALEPVARAQMTDPDAGGEPRAPSFPALGVAKAADLVRASSLGPLAQATNPVAASDLLALAADFAAISRDPDAMDYFLATPVMQRIQDLPSIHEARRILEADPELASMFGADGVSADAIRALMESPTVLRAFDETTVISDLRPLQHDLVAAIRAARARVRSGSNGR